jgi:hypothetical protein
MITKIHIPLMIGVWIFFVNANDVFRREPFTLFIVYYIKFF